jgi:hypothetical protein
VAAAPGAPAQRKLRERALTTGTGGISPAFPAQWFTAYFELSPVNQRLPPSEATMRFPHRRQLGACMGAPGPHDFAVRESCRSSIGTLAATATRLACRDDRDTPLCNRGGMRGNYGKSEILKSRIFLHAGLDKEFAAGPGRANRFEFCAFAGAR